MKLKTYFIIFIGMYCFGWFLLALQIDWKLYLSLLLVISGGLLSILTYSFIIADKQRKEKREGGNE